MNNVYATPFEIKAAMPDAVRSTTTSYDLLLLRLSRAVSRFIDARCGRVFYPSYGTKAVPGSGTELVVIPDAVAIERVRISHDGRNYQELTSDDWYGSVFDDESSPASWRTLVTTCWGQAQIWPEARRGVEITGWWGYADDRERAWEDSGAVLAAGASAETDSLAVEDLGAVDAWGIAAFQVGQLVRVDDELMEVTRLVEADGSSSLTVLRGQNGTTAATHEAGAATRLWRVAEPVKQAAIIQAARQLERGLQGFGDARANPELGSMLYIKRIDPEADLMLQGYLSL
jgi:hypothetical protein